MIVRTSIALAAALVLAAPQAHAQDAQSQPAQVLAKLSDAEIARRVDAVIDRFRSRPEFVGLSVAVARGDQMVIDRGAGTADLEWNEPADATTIFRIGSVTKQFTAAAIMKLVEQGKVHLDDSLAKYLPDFDTEGHTVTIRELLDHTSGIPNYTAQPGFWAKPARLDLSDQEVLDLVKSVPFDFEPGTSWRYSNTNYFLLGMIVEKVSGRAYADFMRETFFEPLGLSHTLYGSETAIVPHRAQGYAYDPVTMQPRNDAAISMRVPGGAGGLVSTAGDLVRWQIALTNGRAVSRASFQQMIGSPVDMGQADMKYGFGLFINRLDGQRVIEHDGGINGFNAILSWLPDIGLRMAVISNSEVMPSAIVERQIIAALTSDKPPPPPRTTPQPGAEAALRKLIADQANGSPDYATMSPALADAVRAQLPRIQPLFKSWGPIKEVTFLGVDLSGIDSYRVDFASGPSAIFDIVLAPDGAIATTRFRPASLPAP